MRRHNIIEKTEAIFLCLLLLLAVHLPLLSTAADAQDNMFKLMDKKQKEIKEKEEAIEKDEERLNALKKDVDERIAKYTGIMNRLEKILSRIEHLNDDKLRNVVKAYEAMPPEKSAECLSTLDEKSAVKIIQRMKSKKAGAVLAQMKTKKAVSITKKITRIAKKFPVE